MGPTTRVSAPPEWAAPPPADPDSALSTECPFREFCTVVRAACAASYFLFLGPRCQLKALGSCAVASAGSIDPVYMIQQIGVLHEANRPGAAGAGLPVGSAADAEDGDEDADVESAPAVVAATRLWDLAAGDARAAFLVQHQLHDVALLILAQHERHPPRLCELCMGCLANLASVAEVAPMLLADEEEFATAVLRVWMTCPDALVLSETARLHLAFASCDATRDTWLRHITADEPLNQLVCLAMSAKEPLLLARLCAVLQQVLRDMAVAYHLVGKCHLATILTHLLETEVPPSLSTSTDDSDPDCRNDGGGRGNKRSFEQTGTLAQQDDDEIDGCGLREGALTHTPWSRGTSRAFGAQTATLADQAVDSGGLQSALFFQLHAAEVLAYFSQEAVVSATSTPEQETGPPSKGESSAAGIHCCPARELAQQDGLQRVIMTVVRRTKGKGSLGRPALATLDYLLELPAEKGGWQLQTLPGAVPAFAALCSGMATAVAAIQASAEQPSSSTSAGSSNTIHGCSGLLALSTEEELSEFRAMVSIGWAILAKLVGAAMPKLRVASGTVCGSDDATKEDGMSPATSGDLCRLVSSDQFATTLVEVVKADLVPSDEALSVLQALGQCRGLTRSVASGDCDSPTTMMLLETVKSIGVAIPGGDLESTTEK